MQRNDNQPTNPDVLAFHEAFADLVALLQHFALTDVLEHEIIPTRGNLETESVIGTLAIQFGRVSGKRAALRDAIGRMEDGKWHRLQPDPAQYDTTTRFSRSTTPAPRTWCGCPAVAAASCRKERSIPTWCTVSATKRARAQDMSSP
jgi:hypothetical protein